MRWGAVILLVVVALASVLCQVEGIQCIGQAGAEVDWWVVLKYPYGYKSSYLDSTGVNSCETGSCWSAAFDIRSDNAVTNTVRLLQKEGTGFLFYNDEDPTSGEEMYQNAHSKGAVIFDQQSGVWLVHSAPKYPARLVDENWWVLRPPQSRFGQHFVCASLTRNSTDSVFAALALANAYIYDKADVSQRLKDLYPNLAKLSLDAAELAPVPPQLKQRDDLLTRAGVQLTAFTKAPSPRNPLHIHEDFIEAEYKTAILWETWRYGGEPTFCPMPGFAGYNIKNISVPETGAKWVTLNDHSKWGVSVERSLPVTCFGDLNRAESQAKRGGGFLCWKNPSLWLALRKLVVDYETCPPPSVQ